MNRWNTFLDSLATRGGSIFLMAGFVAGLTGLIVHLLHTHATGDVTTVILSAFSAFEGALLTVLTSTARAATGTQVSSIITTSTPEIPSETTITSKPVAPQPSTSGVPQGSV